MAPTFHSKKTMVLAQPPRHLPLEVKYSNMKKHSKLQLPF